MVEREVERRVKEVGQYIDPATTTPFAVAVDNSLAEEAIAEGA